MSADGIGRAGSGGLAWRLHAALAVTLVVYAATYTFWTAVRPFGRDSLAFLAGSDVGSLLPPLAAGALGLLASRRCSGRPRRGWLLLGLGWLAWGFGETTWAVYEVILRVETPFPRSSTSDTWPRYRSCSGASSC